MKSGILKKFMAAEEQKEEMSLQITSMADIFTIILIFLLKSFATGMATITPPQGMVLPSVTTQLQDQMKEALKIEILPDSVLVDAKAIIRAHNFKLDETNNSDPTQAASAVSQRVVEALTQERLRSANKGKETHLMVLAHEKAPYATVRTIINSAATAGYVDLQLVVVGAE